ncbi:MAG: ATPase [Chloroflexi bacterium]|nr:MAG: ATPase [Chloroflexota bacterium]
MSGTTILCLASYFKGGRFLEECKRLGGHTILLTTEKLKDEAWPYEAIDERFLLPELNTQPDITYAVSYLAREREIDRIVALDDYDVETAAALREHLRLPGMGESRARFFRDKLAMRIQASSAGILVPDFVPILNYGRIRSFMERVPPPWVLKPRSEASSMGIKKLHYADELWPLLDQLGDRQSFYVLERFVPGDVFHVDSIVIDGNVQFAAVSRYGLPPMTVYHGGGVFVTGTIPYGSEEDRALQTANRAVITALGMKRGVTHAEFIRSQEEGRFYFLEIAARVGGAGIDLMVEHATGANLWAEWARLEVAAVRSQRYELPPLRQQYAALIVSLARQEWPDTSAYAHPEVVWRLSKKHHVGLILASPDHEQIQALIGDYVPRIAADFTASAPPLEQAPA